MIDNNNGTIAPFLLVAWLVGFVIGIVYYDSLYNYYAVRAVRAGSLDPEEP